jgi:flagellar basal-body rod protein FlgB
LVKAEAESRKNPMFEKLEITRMAQALAAHSGARLGVIAQNVANADTPGYRAADLPDFARFYDEDGGSMRATRPGHLAAMAGTAGEPVFRADAGDAPNGNSVSLETEMMKGVEARQSHDMALSVYKSLSEMLRLSLGRGR